MRQIIIEGGFIEAQGMTCGAGIGSNAQGRVGVITITGGNVTATGGWHGAGIGGGKHSYFESFTDIVISGGTVTATGGNGAAGIGNGNESRDLGQNITITSGITKVTARKGGTEVGEVNAFPIGPGHDAQVGNVVFGGYTVFDGSTWSPDPMVSGIYGDLNVVVSGDTWTLTPYHGKFTVNASGKKVIFSPGNLQYKGDEASCKWRFAQQQYDRNTNQSDYQWINHFGWGTWTGGSPDPNKSSVRATDYTWNGADFTKEQELADEQQRGYNWYTLSSDEWQYLFANHTYGAASVHGVNGVIVLPDGVTSATGFTGGMNGFTAVSDDDWEAMEAINALFLPTAGYFDPTTVSFVNFQDGDYWTSSARSTGAYGLHFTGSSLSASHFAQNNRPQRKLVRLVRNAE